MKPCMPMLTVALVIALTLPALAADAPPVTKTYAALEIARFEVNREDYNSKESERAGRIPDEVLDTIQRVLISEVVNSKKFATVAKAGATAGGEGSLELGGRVVDWLPGSKVARMFVGMGAGQQKIEVECVLKDKATGQVLARETILDRKVGGITGGSEEKGIRDFAEKVMVFIDQSLAKSGSVASAAKAPASQP
jgi:hypothetical protein